MDNVTEKQLKLIKNITAELGVKFTGTTKKEASEFISKHINNYKHSRDGLDNWAIVHGYF